MPKRGQVLIWPSVLDDDPNEKDDRTDHQALPVEAGIKYGANAWLHMRDFKVRIHIISCLDYNFYEPIYLYNSNTKFLFPSFSLRIHMKEDAHSEV